MTTNAIIRVHQHGGPDCLKLDELPLEPLQTEHLLVEVQAAGVNFFDTQLRSGLYKQPLPLALGNEGAASKIEHHGKPHHADHCLRRPSITSAR